MTDVRKMIADQMGQLILANIELSAQVNGLAAENAELKKAKTERPGEHPSEGNGFDHSADELHPN